MKTARQTAVEALLRVERYEAWSNLALSTALERSGLPSRDRAFASALFYGALSRRLTLDTCLAPLSKKPLDKLDPSVRGILETAVYQLLWMPSVPESAAVHEAVNLTKQFRKASAGPFVNGVLRAFLRAGKQIPLPEGPLSARLAVEFSCPQHLVATLLCHYAEGDVREMLADSLEAAPVFLRVNPLKTTAEELINQLRESGAEAEMDGEVPGCLRVQQAGDLREHALCVAGHFHLQDRSSQLAALTLGAKPGERVLDCCAAPGGKTVILAQEMGDSGELVAADLHSHRVGLIEKRAEAMGLSCISAIEADMTAEHPELGRFHRVLCDVPCSGLGVMRRRPEIKYRWNGEENLPALQYKILESSANYCQAGGRLLYSTCTVDPGENGGVTARFLESHPEFRELSRRQILPGEGGGDGFFLSLMERVG